MSNELEAKKTLLQNEDLYHLYKDMVVSGVITADEFWANRQVCLLVHAHRQWRQALGDLTDPIG